MGYYRVPVVAVVIDQLAAERVVEGEALGREAVVEGNARGMEGRFRFEAPANSPILVAVGYPSAGGTLGLDVFAERDLTAPAASSRDPALTTQWVDFAADSAGGVFFIRVSGPGVANQRYDLGVIVD